MLDSDSDTENKYINYDLREQTKVAFSTCLGYQGYQI